LCQGEDALDVKVHNLAESSVWVFFNRASPSGTGVVDENIEI
jgi:hypothetical protein